MRVRLLLNIQQFNYLIVTTLALELKGLKRVNIFQFVDTMGNASGSVKKSSPKKRKRFRIKRKRGKTTEICTQTDGEEYETQSCYLFGTSLVSLDTLPPGTVQRYIMTCPDWQSAEINAPISENKFATLPRRQRSSYICANSEENLTDEGHFDDRGDKCRVQSCVISTNNEHSGIKSVEIRPQETAGLINICVPNDDTEINTDNRRLEGEKSDSSHVEIKPDSCSKDNDINDVQQAPGECLGNRRFSDPVYVSTEDLLGQIGEHNTTNVYLDVKPEDVIQHIEDVNVLQGEELTI